jgi:hypothetical protein
VVFSRYIDRGQVWIVETEDGKYTRKTMVPIFRAFRKVGRWRASTGEDCIVTRRSAGSDRVEGMR